MVQMNEDAARRAEMGDDEDDDDDDDDHSPSAGSAASLELYQSVRAIIPDSHLRDKDQISMKSDCATGLRRRLSILNAPAHKVCLLSAVLSLRPLSTSTDSTSLLLATTAALTYEPMIILVCYV